ncbi:MAG: sugar phosphate isomerase/epimerase [Ruminococcaceae bacterium]|nr:sugar phosphate isomerase/epimerase [Oscillospiraceae bacterium]
MRLTNYNQFYHDRKQFGIEYAAAHTVSLGFDAVEYLVLSFTEHAIDAQKEKEILDRHGLCVTCYSVYVQLFTPDRADVERQMLRQVETAAALGAKYFHHTLFPPYNRERIANTYDEVYDGIVDMAERIAKACNKHGIVCLYEPQGAYFNGIIGLKTFLSEMKKRNCEVGVCGDFGNSVFVDVDPRDVFKAFAGEIRHVHVKDYLVTDTDIPEKKAHRSIGGRLIYESELGEGSVDFAYGFRELKRAGYDGAISFEIQKSDGEFAKAISYIKDVMKKAGF